AWRRSPTSSRKATWSRSRCWKSTSRAASACRSRPSRKARAWRSKRRHIAGYAQGAGYGPLFAFAVTPSALDCRNSGSEGPPLAVTADPAATDDQDARVRRERWLDGLGDAARGARRLAVACTVAGGWLLLPQAWTIAVLLDAVLARGRGLDGTLPLFLLLGGCLATRAVLAWRAGIAAGDLAEGVRQELRRRAWAALHARGPRWLRRQRSGALAELVLSHAEAAGDYHAGYRLARAEVAWVPPVLLLAVAAADLVPGLLLLFAAPLLPVSMALVGWGAESASRAQLAELARMGGHFADRLRGLGLIRLYGRGEAELAGIADRQSVV